MRRWTAGVVACLVLLAGMCGTACAQTTVILSDDFETGGLDTDTWDYLSVLQHSSWAGPYPDGPPILPEVRWDPERQSHVLWFSSILLWDFQCLGAIYELPPFDPDDVLVMTGDASREGQRPAVYFAAGVKVGMERPDIGIFGETSIPAAAGAYLPSATFMLNHDTNGVGYEISAFRVIARPDRRTDPDPVGNRQLVDVPAEWELGAWHSLRVEHTTSTFSAYFDDRELATLEVDNYFDTTMDWILILGDASSYFSFVGAYDDITLLMTKRAVQDAVVRFGIPYDEADALYNQYGGTRMQACADCSYGSYALYLDCLEESLREEALGVVVMLSNGWDSREVTPSGKPDPAATYRIGQLIEGECVIEPVPDSSEDTQYVTMTLYAVAARDSGLERRTPLRTGLLRVDAAAGRCGFALETDDLAPGIYDLRFGLPFLDHLWVRVELGSETEPPF